MYVYVHIYKYCFILRPCSSKIQYPIYNFKCSVILKRIRTTHHNPTETRYGVLSTRVEMCGICFFSTTFFPDYAVCRDKDIRVVPSIWRLSRTPPMGTTSTRVTVEWSWLEKRNAGYLSPRRNWDRLLNYYYYSKPFLAVILSF